MLKLAVFVSGRGSNLKAILKAIEAGLKKVEIKAVVSNNLNSPAIDIAREYGINSYFVSLNKEEGFISYNDLLHEFGKIGINFIVLAGFLKKIPDELIDSYLNRIINIHPALLPSFGGKGMYGMHVHKAVFNASTQVSGASVHFVDKIYDHGKIIAQQCIDISDVKSPEEIAEKVLRIEHRILPYVIKKFSENKVQLEKNRVYIED